MSAYVITDIDVSDTERYQSYIALSPAAIAAFGGEFIVRGGNPEVLEGQWPTSRVVVVKFASKQQAKAFYESALYQQAKAARAGATKKFNMIIVEGIA
jgi:uncharacterized protein (DUF1330 family)